MTTQGIEAVFMTTRHWGKSAKFFQALGFGLEFDAGRNSDGRIWHLQAQG